MINLHLSSIECNEETAEWGDDSPYVLISSVELAPSGRVPPIPGTPVQPPISSDVILHIFNDMETGERALWNNFEPFWGTGGLPATLADPNNAIFVVALMERDSGNPQLARGAVRTATLTSLASTLAVPRAGKVSVLRRDIASALALPTSIPGLFDSDEAIGSPQELSFTTDELARAESGQRVSKTMVFEGDDGRYTLVFDAVRAGWRNFVNIADPAFRALPGAPINVAMQRGGGLIATVVDVNGVPSIAWQQANAPWHPFVRIAAFDQHHDGFTIPSSAPMAHVMVPGGDLILTVVGGDGVPYMTGRDPNGAWSAFERVAAHDVNFVDGFTVPPGAHLAMGVQKDGVPVLTVIGKDGIPYISRRQSNGRWRSFERLAPIDSRFFDGFTVPPGAPMALATQPGGDLVFAVVGRNGVPYISWRQADGSWHLFERVAAYDARFPDGFTVPPGAHLAMGVQRNGSLVLTVIGWDGVPYVSWHQIGVPWHSFERIAGFDPRFPDGFTVPPGAPMALATQPGQDLVLTIAGREGVPYMSWRQPDGSWNRFERVADPDPQFVDGFTVPPGAYFSMATQTGNAFVMATVGRDGVPYMSWRAG